MAVVLIRIAAFLALLYFVVAYGRFIGAVIKDHDYWTYGLCLALTFGVALWMDWRNKR